MARKVIDELRGDTDYEIQVRAIGPDGQTSPWSKVYSVRTMSALNTRVILLENGQTVENYVIYRNHGVPLPVGTIIIEKAV